MYEEIWGNLLPPQLATDGLSNTLRNSVVTPPDAPIPDCMTCGACCKSFVCVSVRPSDKIDPEIYWDVTGAGENGEFVVDRYLRRDGETLACSALGGTIGESVACTIYETRPRMCRHFEAGSDRCHALRRAFGIEPFLTLGEMFEANKKLNARPAAAAEVIRNAQITSEPGTRNLRINVLMKDGNLLLIHTYDPDLETWMQFEFEGLKMNEALTLIDERKRSATGFA